MQELAPGVFVETGYRRVTVGAILTAAGFVLIDTPPYPEDAWHWRDQLSTIAEKPVLAIVLTDGHRDRLLGNCWFGTSVIVAHDETMAHVNSLPATFLDNAIDALASNSIEREQFAGVRLMVPGVGFSRRMQLRYGGRHIPLWAMRGPTAGSLWVHLPEQKIVFAGDCISVNEHPYISSPTTKDWLEALTMLRRSRFPADHIVPGRGPLVDKAATEPVSNYLRLARRRVQSLYRAGRPRADTSTIVPELLELFPYNPSESELLQKRIKSGLDRIYEEIKASDTPGELTAR